MAMFLTDLARRLMKDGELPENISETLKKIEKNPEYEPIVISEFVRLETAFEKSYIFEIGASA